MVRMTGRMPRARTITACSASEPLAPIISLALHLSVRHSDNGSHSTAVYEHKRLTVYSTRRRGTSLMGERNVAPSSPKCHLLMICCTGQ